MTTDVRSAGGRTFRVAWSFLAALALVAGILVVAAPPAAAWPAKISIGGSLDTNEKLVSPNGRYNLTMQENGNLVLRGASEGIIWSPEMDGSGSVKAQITDAGNVVLRQADGDVMWASGTTKWASSATTLEVTNSGNVLLSNAAGDHLWRVGLSPAIHGVEAMIEYAKEQLGKPYKLGYHGPTWFDCSGLSLQGIRAGGLAYGWTAGPDAEGHTASYTQYSDSDLPHKIDFKDRRRGDLVFWDLNPRTEGVSHVAIYLGAGRMIHTDRASKPLRIESVGVFPSSSRMDKVVRPFP
ncbi:NlpC/P60 family protein [Myceligenerans pegani]|uniref:C40 family peptidase n=1 Tax=Myceligenerans pegani TaxID=2776917 RepID=A0ABR9N5Z2_9MICO|nr:NlpC/P60 family protein [Myceligenerans sp. TRM 65318]MBE1878437.1 C40 family peptidase [Myceligenerans sp. TRM 65318]MBE3020708.1 C40 family peptidase [Myceligenerans sp. TRM 65318]